MNVLIVNSDPDLGQIWADHLRRLGLDVDLARSQDDAVDELLKRPYAVIVLNLLLAEGSALAVSDFVSYRHPDARVIFVTNSSYFSDGSIFNHATNARAIMPQNTRPEDLAAVIDYCAAS